MLMTLPRTTMGLQSMTTRRYFSAALLTFSCLLMLVTGSPVKSEERTSQLHSNNQAERLQNVEKPAAHFQADPFIDGSLQWTADIDNSFSQGNLKLDNNKLLIQRTGLYFIYTQATFGGVHCPTDKKENVLSHSVILESVEREEIMQLLDAQKTACGVQPRAGSAHTGSWGKSIFQGGAFKLNKGDRLYTKTYGNQYLKRENGATYFGGYAL
ncbi:lymphotoxin-alpha-like [Mixophyes fleayi]|uniref:lymphotoxin-alpha-like n=1 Tax=Mixophyes fleayi TaxID=3061075 RepID=UPI003F4D9C5A